MTRRLAVIGLLGLAAIAAASGGALLTLRGSTAPPPASPTWGLFDDAEWKSVTARLGPDAHVVTAMSSRLAIVSDGRCFALVRDAHVSARICRLATPVVAFSVRDGRLVDVVGLASPRVATLVIVEGGRREGAALLPAGALTAFGFGSPAPPTLEALGGDGRVVARRYCASDLRGVCGMSAHRRS